MQEMEEGSKDPRVTLSQREGMGLGSCEGCGEQKVREHLKKLDIQVHGTQEEAPTRAGHSLVIFDRSWWLGDVSEDCKKASVIPTPQKGKKDLGSDREVTLLHL